MTRTSASVKQTDLPHLKLRGPLTLVDNGLVNLELRPDLDFAIASALGKPSAVSRGAESGFSLPLYAANEELFFTMCLPDRWDEASDIKAHIYCYLAAAEDDHAFRLQLSWERLRPSANQVVPDTTQDIEVETNTGALAAQFKSFVVDFSGVNAIPYDTVDHELQIDDSLCIRLRRVDKTGAKDECTGEIVITHLGLIFRRNKLGEQA